MRLSILACFAALSVVGCAETALHVTLVPADALFGVLPDSVGTFEIIEEATNRGYFADSTGALALITASRVYRSGGALLSISVSSMDDASRYVAFVEGNGGQVVPDSLAQQVATMQMAQASGWQSYAVAFGWLFVNPDGRAVEAKSMFSESALDALDAVDLDRLAALSAVPVALDSSFVRAPLAPRTAAAEATDTADA